ncbi:TetR/AcrR family transcriptional regulator [Lactiplantibacillus sp. WILCCON 0030]|uniref:TetR/AcrR family transcriptional regulator n=1 Tax=Lactiplantibacillus brownii TaxID=3069269 RepID=A0ABU1A829_9LACO|nr:TetR/AcrR family transcriptional regulator [Lactiplantibacillus brownii]MDQ7937033.1 TetR/AcrR family transcriptional regulator [Lactiplantibacillus brownii]
MAKTDLRVIKTKRAIKTAFNQLIVKKPVNKITITELTQLALINKGTFYLHYPDIYALYDEVLAEFAQQSAANSTAYPLLFTHSRTFVREFLFGDTPTPTADQLALLKPENSRFATDFPQVLLAAFKQAIYAVGKLTPNQTNDIKLDFLLNGMIGLLVKPALLNADDPACVEFTVQFVSRMIEQALPEFYPTKKVASD